MKQRLIILCCLLLAGMTAKAQTLTWQLSETGWGRIEKGFAYAAAMPESSIGEMNIPRWRKATGTLTVNFDKKEAVLTQRGKADKTFTLLSESTPKETRDGWTYIEYMALDAHNSVCHFWLCTHAAGAVRLLTLYPWTRPDTVYGYQLSPAE